MLVEHVQTNGATPRVRRRPDELIVEEPLEIRLDGHLVTTTMRTPGDDFELAAGDMAALDVLDEGLHTSWDPSDVP